MFVKCLSERNGLKGLGLLSSSLFASTAVSDTKVRIQDKSGRQKPFAPVNTNGCLSTTSILILKANCVYKFDLKGYCLLATLFLKFLCTGHLLYFENHTKLLWTYSSTCCWDLTTQMQAISCSYIAPTCNESSLLLWYAFLWCSWIWEVNNETLRQHWLNESYLTFMKSWECVD